jgi:hypothetical protein
VTGLALSGRAEAEAVLGKLRAEPASLARSRVYGRAQDQIDLARSEHAEVRAHGLRAYYGR